LNPISQGLYISALGLLITFLALGILILIMVGLKRLFPYKAEAEEDIAETTIEVQVDESEDEALVAAAIATAIQYFGASGKNSLGANLARGRGAWWATNRISANQGVNILKKN
jgi:sodium pump decarboxylase gamma subunit